MDENALQPGGVRLINSHLTRSFLTRVRIRCTRTGIGETCIGQIHTSTNWRSCATAMQPTLSEWWLFQGDRDRLASPDVQNTSASSSKSCGYPLLSKTTPSTQEAAYVLTSFSHENWVCNSRQPISGSNAYAVLSSPRYSGAEAAVISASWSSRTGEGDGTLNLRGVATVLSLAAFLNRQSQHPKLLHSANFFLEYSFWSKDLIFVISDGYMEGMQAWASAYHAHSQSSTPKTVVLLPC